MAPARTSRPAATAAAAVLYVFLGLAFGISVPFVLAFLAENGYLPMTFGFKSLAGGPLERLDRELFIAAGWLLVAVSAGSVAAGVLLWRGRRIGVWLGLAADPIAFGLGVGFALRLQILGVPARAGLLLLGLQESRRPPPETSDEASLLGRIRAPDAVVEDGEVKSKDEPGLDGPEFRR